MTLFSTRKDGERVFQMAVEWNESVNSSICLDKWHVAASLDNNLFVEPNLLHVYVHERDPPDFEVPNNEISVSESQDTLLFSA